NGADAVLLGRQIIRPHRRRLHWIGGLDLDHAARLWTQLADREGAARPIMRLAAGLVRRQRAEVKLNVGCLRAWQDAREQAALIDTDAERPGALEQPLQADARLARETAQIVIGRDRF